MKIDFLTTVIDNYGDAGFAFNLAISLTKLNPNLQIRFFLDNKKLFLKLSQNLDIKNIVYYNLTEFKKLKPLNIIFNFFDKKIDFKYLHKFDYEIKLFNFSYFLMHSGVKSLHKTSYTSKNVSVLHYIPSLLNEGGGVIINPYLKEFEEKVSNNIEFYKKQLIPNLEDNLYKKDWISVFCYKKTFDLIKEHILNDKKNLYLIFDNKLDGKNVINMPFLGILDYYKILYLCKKNIVRGENSLIQAMICKKPFLWDIYKESNQAHIYKINDFLNYLSFNFGNSFLNYNNILKEFNIGNAEKRFFDFIKISQDLVEFVKIGLEVEKQDLIKKLFNIID